jgi:phosphoadenosine phosphosulfate reductase
MALLDLATGVLLSDAAETATLLEPDADSAALAAASSGNAGPIAIRFPVVTDGRGFSLARLLRDRHGFTGEIRAVGHLIPDLGQFLLRSGFDTAEIEDAEHAPIWKASVSRITHNYQRGYRNLLPLRRDAARKEAETLNERLGRIKSLTDRIREMRRRIEGRIAFSTSLQLEDQAILHAVAESGAEIDVFTLDTGRLFPEVLETVEFSEIRYGLRIRLVTPEAKGSRSLWRARACSASAMRWRTGWHAAKSAKCARSTASFKARKAGSPASGASIRMRAPRFHSPPGTRRAG